MPAVNPSVPQGVEGPRGQQSFLSRPFEPHLAPSLYYKRAVTPADQTVDSRFGERSGSRLRSQAKLHEGHPLELNGFDNFGLVSRILHQL